MHKKNLQKKFSTPYCSFMYNEGTNQLHASVPIAQISLLPVCASIEHYGGGGTHTTPLNIFMQVRRGKCIVSDAVQWKLSILSHYPSRYLSHNRTSRSSSRPSALRTW